MRVLKVFALRLRGLFRSRRAEADLAAELESHVALHTDAGVRNGLTPEEARREALIRLGGAEQTRQAYRERRTLPWLESVLRDAAFGLRTMARHPGFTVVAVVTLAIGIGAGTAIFSAIKPILIDPLPYPHAGRLMTLMEMRKNGQTVLPTFCSFQGLSQRSQSFDHLSVFKPWQVAATSTSETDRPERFHGQRVSANFFRTLDVAPLLGRDFDASDDRVRGPNVVVLSNRLWQRRFSSDANIAGKQIRLDDQLYTVVGVMPADFEDVEDPTAEIWAPLQYDPALPGGGREWGHHLRLIARLKPDINGQQASAELHGVMHGLAQTYAKGYDSTGGAPETMMIQPLQRDLTKAVRPALFAVLGAVSLVLLIACVNLANLLLVRGSQRRAEFAMRATLGAARSRLVSQLLTESMMIALLGGALGLVVAEIGVKALVLLSPPALPRLNAIAVDGSIFVFAFLLTSIIGVAVGLISSAQAGRSDLNADLRQGSGRATTGRHFTRSILVVAEVSLAVVLLVSTGLLLRSMQRLLAVDPGFDASSTLTMQVQEPGQRCANATACLQFYQQALDNIRSLPGVVSAGFTSQLPLNGDQDVYGIQFEKDNSPRGQGAYRYAVSPDYFRTMQIPLLRGRLLNEHDGLGAPIAILISQSIADSKFAGENPIGQRVKVGPDAGDINTPWATIVGVVGNVKQESLAITDDDAFYISTPQWVWIDAVQSLVVRTRTQADATSLAPSIQRAIWSVDKDRPVDHIATMETLVATTAQERRFVLILFEAFGVVALALAAIGIYGILAGSVTERTREIGVRSALGATRANLLALVLRQGLTMTAIGLAGGLCMALFAARALNAMLFGVSWLDTFTYCAATLLLFVVSLVACLIPARRAASVDPMQALRTE